ncbi:MAG TPA: hypothetical protein VF772_13590, partial [Terriglobales bacterium]
MISSPIATREPRKRDDTSPGLIGKQAERCVRMRFDLGDTPTTDRGGVDMKAADSCLRGQYRVVSRKSKTQLSRV